MKILANSSSITGGINSQPKSSREVCKDLQNHLFGGVEDKYVVSCMKKVEEIFALIMFDCIFGIKMDIVSCLEEGLGRGHAEIRIQVIDMFSMGHQLFVNIEGRITKT